MPVKSLISFYNLSARHLLIVLWIFVYEALATTPYDPACDSLLRRLQGQLSRAQNYRLQDSDVHWVLNGIKAEAFATIRVVGGDLARVLDKQILSSVPVAEMKNAQTASVSDDGFLIAFSKSINGTGPYISEFTSTGQFAKPKPILDKVRHRRGVKPKFILGKRVLRIMDGTTDALFFDFSQVGEKRELISLAKALGGQIKVVVALTDTLYGVLYASPSRPDALFEMIVDFDPTEPDQRKILVSNEFSKKDFSLRKLEFIDSEGDIDKTISFFSVEEGAIEYTVPYNENSPHYKIHFNIETGQVFSALPVEKDTRYNPIKVMNSLKTQLTAYVPADQSRTDFRRVINGEEQRWSVPDNRPVTNAFASKQGLLLFLNDNSIIIYLQNDGQKFMLRLPVALDFIHVVGDQVLGFSRHPRTLKINRLHVFSLQQIFQSSKGSLSYVQNANDLKKYLWNKIEFQALQKKLLSVQNDREKVKLMVEYVTTQNEISDEEFMFLYSQLPKAWPGEERFQADGLLKSMQEMGIVVDNRINFVETLRFRFIWLGLSKVKYAQDKLSLKYMGIFETAIEESVQIYGSSMTTDFKNSLSRFILILLQKALKSNKQPIQ